MADRRDLHSQTGEGRGGHWGGFGPLGGGGDFGPFYVGFMSLPLAADRLLLGSLGQLSGLFREGFGCWA